MKHSSKYRGRKKTHSIKKIYVPSNHSQKSAGRCAPPKLGSKPKKKKEMGYWKQGAHDERGKKKPPEGWRKKVPRW